MASDGGDFMVFSFSRALHALIISAGLFLALPTGAMAHEHTGAPERFVDGTLEIVHIDEADQGQSRFAYFLLTAEGDGPGNSGAAFELRFERTPPADLQTGDRLNVRGRAVGRNLWVDDIAAADQDGSTGTVQETLAESVVDSPRSAVVILVNITGTTTWTNSNVTTVENVMYNNTLSVDGIYAEASFNQTGFPASAGTVVAPVTVDKITNCPVFDYAVAADAAATATGVDLSLYQHRIYIIPSDSAADSDCNWLAQGVLGSYGSTGTLRSWSTLIDASAIAHEVGHNAGWHHAATDTNNNGANFSESTDVEYGDTSDTMGYCCTEKKFNAVHMDQIGWYDNQPAGTMLTVGSSGTYTLAPLGSDPVTTPGTQILKVSKPDTGEVYYLSYRQRIGRDANVPTAYIGGLNIHHASETGRWSYFIQALADAQNFDDPANGLIIAQNWHDATGVNITISYDSCLPANPTVSVAPAAQSVDPIATPAAFYDVTVTNNDSAGCDPATFVLASSDLGALGADSVLVSASAASDAVVLTVNTQMADGDYGVAVTASRNANTGAGSGALTIDSLAPTQPGAAAAVQKKVKGQQSIEVSWGASSDAGTGVAHYRISRDGGSIGTTSSLKSADTAATLDVTHDYTIVAIDGVGHASSAVTVTFTPGGGGTGPGNSGGKGGKKK
jgi:hypothetical protein